MYDSKCWPKTKRDEALVSVIKTKLLRWCSGIRRLDCIIDETIRKMMEVAPAKDKQRGKNV